MRISLVLPQLVLVSVVVSLASAAEHNGVRLGQSLTDLDDDALSTLSQPVRLTSAPTKLSCQDSTITTKGSVTALNGSPFQSYRASPAVWNHIVLP